MNFFRSGRRWTLDLHVGRRWLTFGRWPRLFVTYTISGVGPRWHWSRDPGDAANEVYPGAGYTTADVVAYLRASGLTQAADSVERDD